MIVPVTSPWRLCRLSKLILTLVFVVLIPVTLRPLPKSFINWSTDSLVILFFSSLVATSPIGVLLAKDFAAGGLSSILSLSL